MRRSSKKRISSQKLASYLQISPWDNDEKLQTNEDHDLLKNYNEKKHKPKKKKSKNQIFNTKKPTERSSLRNIEYTLPMIPATKIQTIVEKSFGGSPTQGKLLQKKSSKKLKNYFDTLVIDKKKVDKMKLNGKKFDLLPSYRVTNRWLSQDTKNTMYSSSITPHTLLFNKKKEDVLKNVLVQLQTKLK